MEVLKIAGALVTFVGSLFLFLGALGIARMPDLYNRMQMGIGIYHPAWLGRMVLLVIFVAMTNPLSTHALARAAHFIGVPLTKGSVCDTLADDEKGDEA